MSVSQLEIRVRPVRWRVCLSSLAQAGVTALILWAAVADLLSQGRLETVLSPGRAELAAPLLVALVVATGMCERIWPAKRRPVLARGHVQDACDAVGHTGLDGRSRSSRPSPPGRPRC